MLFSGNANTNGTYNYNIKSGSYDLVLIIFSNGYNINSVIGFQGSDIRLSSFATPSYYSTCHAIFSTSNFTLKEITSVGYSGLSVTHIYGIK